MARLGHIDSPHRAWPRTVPTQHKEGGWGAVALLLGGNTYAGLPPGADEGDWWVNRQTPGSISAMWTDPDGRIYNLTAPWHTGPGYLTMNGPAAWGSTPIELITDPYPRGGETVRFIHALSRRLQWPLYVGGDSHMEFVTNYRTIMRAFTKTTHRRAPGILEIMRPDGTSRRIQAFYEQGFEGEAGENWLWARPVVQLFCPDGYWYDPEPVRMAADVEITDPEAPEIKNFFRPFITLTKTPAFSDDLDGEDEGLVNPGDVDAWPTWVLTGPMKGFTATNLTTGYQFAFTGAIDAGVSVTITTDPVTVRSSTGLNWAKHIDWFNPKGSMLWPFVPGRNKVSFDLKEPGAGAGIEVAFLPRYETA